jgi:hypothetical protein
VLQHLRVIGDVELTWLTDADEAHEEDPAQEAE